MAATLISTTDSNYGRELQDALNEASVLGLTETIIGAITSTGTVAKLRVKIAALTPHETELNQLRHVLAVFDKCTVLNIIKDADVETARAATSGTRLTSLKTSIYGRCDGIPATSTDVDFQF